MLETYVEQIRAVTKEDVMRVARQYFTEDNRTVGILVPTGK
jgi:zinc protease